MDGALLIDKPQGITSTQVVEEVKKKLKAKVGHTGTLDPIATGLLILLINKATRFAWLFLNLPKTYVFKIQFGAETDTYDAEGKIIRTTDKPLDCEKLRKILEKFKGEIEQIPPPFSAKKVKGKRAYELARKGEKVELKPVKVNIYEIKLLECNERERDAKLFVEISSGGYIRSLAHDIGKELSLGGYVKELRRTKINEISVEETVKLEEFLSAENPWEYVIPVDKLMRFLPEVKLASFQAGKILKGQSVLINNYNYNGLVKIYEGKKFIGVGELTSGILKPKRLMATKT